MLALFDLGLVLDRVALLDEQSSPVEDVAQARRDLEAHADRLRDLEGCAERSSGRWEHVRDIIVNVVGVVVAAYVLGKHGLKP